MLTQKEGQSIAVMLTDVLANQPCGSIYTANQEADVATISEGTFSN